MFWGFPAMYPAVTVSLSCLFIAVAIGLIVWFIAYSTKRSKRLKEEALKRRVKELTGEDFVRGHTTVQDLERQYRKKG